jgi:hypothetical protein
MMQSYLSGLHSEDGRRALAEVLLALFRQWELDEGDQARLLGMEEVASLWQGEPLPNKAEVLERAGQLLAIERALRQQFAEQPLMHERWVSFPNVALDGRTPIERMLEGVDGIRQVREQLEQDKSR